MSIKKIKTHNQLYSIGEVFDKYTDEVSKDNLHILVRYLINPIESKKITSYYEEFGMLMLCDKDGNSYPAQSIYIKEILLNNIRGFKELKYKYIGEDLVKQIHNNLSAIETLCESGFYETGKKESVSIIYEHLEIKLSDLIQRLLICDELIMMIKSYQNSNKSTVVEIIDSIYDIPQILDIDEFEQIIDLLETDYITPSQAVTEALHDLRLIVMDDINELYSIQSIKIGMDMHTICK